jgi:transcription-repair coupling factor (superfamily II helicase)
VKIDYLLTEFSKFLEFELPELTPALTFSEFETESEQVTGAADKIQPITERLTNLDRLPEFLDRQVQSGCQVVMMYSSEGMKQRVEEVLRDSGRQPGAHMGLAAGKYLPSFQWGDWALINLHELFTFRAADESRAARVVRRKKELQLVDLKVGDYLVHEKHGIGRYVGLEFDGAARREYVVVEYRARKRGFPADRLMIPSEHVNWLTKYIGNDRPRINRLGGTEWTATKRQVKRYIKAIAADLVKLYGLRRTVGGYAFGEDTDWQRELEDSFEYVETPDQRAIIAQVKADMESATPMDRLILGDVGFGKTEIALRAAFKAVQDRKQVAVLAPTTILAAQHFETFRARLEIFPVRIELLSRFQTVREAEKIRTDLALGKVDILIGTHSIIQPSTVFHDLGLIIVDEEQRFGVQQKETLKAAKVNVDVLSLSATPIPRTLEMSLSGIKDLSVITTPPENRVAIKTYVSPNSDQTVYQAILNEVSRGGQVFYLFNNVRFIEREAEKIRHMFDSDLFRIETAHGQMPQTVLEKRIHDFVNRKINVLVCSTIIENGLDIVNANTLIVQNAHKFGIAQLHQIRGRVGRSATQAHAYFLYPKLEGLTATAIERLISIKNYSALGSGFQLAQKDLEIRGAGNLLGVEQSGQIEGVGFDLFMKMLAEEIDEIKAKRRGVTPVTGLLPTRKTQPQRNRPDQSVLRVGVAIPKSYIENDVLRLEMYQKMANAATPDQLKDILEEMVDRYGPIPQEMIAVPD